MANVFSAQSRRSLRRKLVEVDVKYPFLRIENERKNGDCGSSAVIAICKIFSEYFPGDFDKSKRPLSEHDVRALWAALFQTCPEKPGMTERGTILEGIYSNIREEAIKAMSIEANSTVVKYQDTELFANHIDIIKNRCESIQWDAYMHNLSLLVLTDETSAKKHRSRVVEFNLFFVLDLIKICLSYMYKGEKPDFEANWYDKSTGTSIKGLWCFQNIDFESEIVRRKQKGLKLETKDQATIISHEDLHNFVALQFANENHFVTYVRNYFYTSSPIEKTCIKLRDKTVTPLSLTHEIFMKSLIMGCYTDRNNSMFSVTYENIDNFKDVKNFVDLICI